MADMFDRHGYEQCKTIGQQFAKPVILLAILVLSLYLLFRAQIECAQVGGTLVRGVIWYECLEGVK